MMDALKMGEYGAYVWSSYGLTFVVLLSLAFGVRRAYARELAAAQRRAQSAGADTIATNAIGEPRA